MSEELENYAAVEPVEREWDALADRVGVPPFLRPGWISAWWSAFGNGELSLIVVRRNGRLAGILPLYRRGRLLASTANWHTPVYGPVVEDRSAAAALAGAVFDQAPRRLRLAFLAEESIAVKELGAAARATGHRVAERVVMRSPYVVTNGDWEAYWRSRSGKQRRGIKRSRKRLEDRGKVSLEVVDGTDRLEERLEEAFEIEASGWKGEHGTAIISQPETRRFYEDVARWAAGRGILRLATLRVDGRAVAMHLSLETGGRYYLLKPGFDPQFAKQGPGKLLDSEMIARAFANSLDSFEFLGSDGAYKLTWADHSHNRTEFQAFSRSPAGIFDRIVQTRGRALARRMMALRR
jgi:CelD/BcsL family acetyltransferase involved in cellulose biosynthesis